MRLRQGMNRFTRVFAVLGTACIMGVGTSGAALAHPPGNAAGPPTTTHNVKPVLSGKHVKACPKGTTTFINTFNMKPGDKSASYSNGGTTFQTTVTKEGKLLSFTTNSPSFTVYIAGARDTDHSWKWWDFGDHTGWFGADDRDDFEGINVYDYTGTPGHPNFAADAGLHAPLKADHKLARISYYIVCGQPGEGAAEDAEAQHCPQSRGHGGRRGPQ